MRFLRIELVNLNAFHGRHQVDLEGGLAGAPLFLIVGPTGSGKSTLMDAIALALFGQTPRLTGRRSDDDHDPRRVMSTGTGEAMAQLEFALTTAEGATRRFRATWSCRRARKRPEGDLQNPQRSLEEKLDDGWKVLVSGDRVRDHQEVFGRILDGLTIEDFKRSVLLAQGQFDAFLKAPGPERATILERLTDTGIYKQIGRRALERWQAETSAFESMEKAVGHIQVLPPEERQQKEVEAGGLATEVERLRGEEERLAATLRWIDERTRLGAALEEARGALTSAEEELQRAATDLSRLAEHERVAGASNALRERDRLAGELRRLEEEELPRLREQAARAGEELERARSDEESARQRHSEALRLQAEQQPAIDEARLLREARKSALKEQADARRTLDERQRQRTEAEATRAGRRGESEAARAKLARLTARRDERQADRAIVERLASIGEQHSAWLSFRQPALVLAAEATRADEERARHAALRDRRAEELREAERLLAEADARHGEPSRRFADALAGAASAAERRAALQAELRAATTTIDGCNRARRALAEREAAGIALGVARQTLERLGDERRSLGEQALLIDTTLRDTRAQLDDLRRRLDREQGKRALLHYRDHLVEGEPCPLCGALSHPFAATPLDEMLRADIEALGQAVTQLEGRLNEQRSARHERDVQLARLEEAEARQRAEVERSEATIVSAERELRSLDLVADGAIPDLATLEAARLEAEDRQLQGGEATRQLEAAEAALRTSESERNAAQGSRLQLAERLDGQVRLAEESARRSSDLAAKSKDAADRALQGAAALRQILVEAGLPATLEAAVLTAHVEEAKRRAGELLSLDAALLEAEREERAAAAAEDKAVVTLEAAAVAETEAAESLALRDAEHQRIASDVRSVFGGEDPDVVARRLQAAVVELEAPLGRGIERTRERSSALDQLRGQLVEREAEMQAKHLLLDESGQQLAAALARLDLPDDAALRDRLLDDETRAAVQARRRVLDAARQLAAGALQKCQRDLDAHLGAPPPLPGPQATRDDVDAAATRARDSLQQAIDRRARLGAELATDDEQRRRRGDLDQRLEQQRHQLETWTRLKNLIGANEGARFKDFAQILNLRQLLDRANAHLARLSPRYRLVPDTREDDDQPRLHFAVEDAWQAGATRALTTLSGGESFLLSLALALGLADFGSTRMPIETLLLDEGFGTLDGETLQTAMQALGALHARGTQVGLISHVAALREAIPAQVIVEPAGGGRSTVRVELVSG